jgi:hypothetical protein
MKKLTCLVAAATITAGAAAPATAAPTIGDTVTCSASSFVCSQASATVGSGTEFTLGFPGFGAVLAVDFSNGLLTIRNIAGVGNFATGGAFSASFADATSPFTMATLVEESGFAVSGFEAFDQSKISLSNGTLALNLSNISFQRGGFATIQLGATTPAVPEPATWAMMIAGFAGVGGALRAGRRAPAVA